MESIPRSYVELIQKITCCMLISLQIYSYHCLSWAPADNYPDGHSAFLWFPASTCVQPPYVGVGRLTARQKMSTSTPAVWVKAVLYCIMISRMTVFTHQYFVFGLLTSPLPIGGMCSTSNYVTLFGIHLSHPASGSDKMTIFVQKHTLSLIARLNPSEF